VILDSSAVVAVALREPGQERLLAAMGSARSLSIGAPTLVEATIVLSARLQVDARGLMGRFLLEGDVAVVPFTEAHFGTAMQAWLRYGRGRHPAGLNFGDCLAYATARLAGEPLLFTGDDFTRTDVEAAVRLP
jgi:ribonuclease VapC